MTAVHAAIAPLTNPSGSERGDERDSRMRRTRSGERGGRTCSCEVDGGGWLRGHRGSVKQQEEYRGVERARHAPLIFPLRSSPAPNQISFSSSLGATKLIWSVNRARPSRPPSRPLPPNRRIDADARESPRPRPPSRGPPPETATQGCLTSPTSPPKPPPGPGRTSTRNCTSPPRQQLSPSIPSPHSSLPRPPPAPSRATTAHPRPASRGVTRATPPIAAM